MVEVLPQYYRYLSPGTGTSGTGWSARYIAVEYNTWPPACAASTAFSLSSVATACCSLTYLDSLLYQTDTIHYTKQIQITV